MGLHNFLIFIILFFIGVQSQAISLMGIVSDKYLSDCKDSDINSAQYNRSISNSLKCSARGNNLSIYTDVIGKAEDQLFSVMAEQQRELVQCHKKNIDTLNRDLKTDTQKQNQFLEKTRYNLVQLQELAYKRARLENSLKTQRAQDILFNQSGNKFRQPSNNQNRRLPEEDFTKSLIAKLDDEIAVMKTSFAHYNASGLQKIIDDSIQSATNLGRAHSSKFSNQTDKLQFLEDVTLEAELFNQFHKKASSDIPSINKLTEIYDDYAKSFQETDDKLGKNVKLVNGEWQYKLSDNLKRELFMGPTGEKFISNTMHNASLESKDMICKLDARYGRERNKNNAVIDSAIGVGLLGLTVAEFFTPAAPAAPVTAAAGMTRIMSVVNVVKNANVVKTAGVGLSTAALFSSAADVAKKCQPSLSQVSSCTEQSSQAQLGKLNLSDCVVASVSTLGGAGTIGITFLRNTKLGRSTAEQFGKFSFAKMRVEQRNRELGYVRSDAIINTRNIEINTEMGKSLLNDPIRLAAANSFWNSGSVLKINALDIDSRAKTVESMTQAARAIVGLNKASLAHAKSKNDLAGAAKMLASIQIWEPRYEAIKKLRNQVYAETMATQLTTSAKKTLDVVSAMDTTAKIGISVNSIRKSD